MWKKTPRLRELAMFEGSQTPAFSAEDFFSIERARFVSHICRHPKFLSSSANTWLCCYHGTDKLYHGTDQLYHGTDKLYIAGRPQKLINFILKFYRFLPTEHKERKLSQGARDFSRLILSMYLIVVEFRFDAMLCSDQCCGVGPQGNIWVGDEPNILEAWRWNHSRSLNLSFGSPPLL